MSWRKVDLQGEIWTKGWPSSSGQARRKRQQIEQQNKKKGRNFFAKITKTKTKKKQKQKRRVDQVPFFQNGPHHGPFDGGIY